jgi:hypothetical protein
VGRGDLAQLLVQRDLHVQVLHDGLVG